MEGKKENMMSKITTNRRQTLAGVLAALLVTVGLILDASAQTVRTFTNPASINIQDLTTANPYPSSITVSNVPPNASRFIVRLKGFTHAYPDDVGVLLVAPDGRRVRLFTDCMGDGGGDGIVTPIDLTIDDFAPLALPDNPSGDTPSGSYKPKRGTSDGVSPQHPVNFPAPAPSGTYAETLATFDNINANGTWRLFVDDDGKNDTGLIQNGWELTFQTLAPTAAQAVISGTAGYSGGNITSARVSMLDINGLETIVYTDLNGYYELPAVPVGETYTLAISAKGRVFSPATQIIQLNDHTTVNWSGL